jgi:hypothetical protein
LLPQKSIAAEEEHRYRRRASLLKKSIATAEEHPQTAADAVRSWCSERTSQAQNGSEQK